MKWVKQYLPSMTSVITMLLLLSPLLIFNPTTSAQSSSAADFLFETGKKYYERSDYQQALHEFKKAILAQPDHPQALIYIQNIKEKLDSLQKQGQFFEPEGEIIREQTAVKPLLKAEAKAIPEKAAGELRAQQELSRQKTLGEYVLGVGDDIEVVVWRHEDLSKALAIRPDGMISLPVVGEIRVAELTPRQVGEIVASRLRRYIRDPEVSVIVTEVRSKRILVLGEVNRPGVYKISTPLTTLEAILGAGGYRKWAGIKSTMIVRRAYSDTPEIISTDLWSVISKGRFDRDIALKSGDIVYVPQRFIGNIQDLFSFFNANIRPSLDAYYIYLLSKAAD